MSIFEAEKEARRNRKHWDAIFLDNDDESWTACKDGVSGKPVVFRKLTLVDGYDEAYLRAISLDFTSRLRLLYCQGWKTVFGTSF